MRKKNIGAILLSVSIVGFCMSSPLFVSKIEDKDVTERIQIVKKEKRDVPLSLLEKIQIYREGEADTEEISKGGTVVESESMEYILEIVREEFNNLCEQGVLQGASIDMFLADKNMECYTKTYVNEEYDSVTIWEVRVESSHLGEEYSCMIQMEKETEKIIGFFADSYEGCNVSFEETEIGEAFLPNHERFEDGVANYWAEYIGAEKIETIEMKDSKGICYEFGKGKDTVRYWINFGREGVSITI